jgi:dihydrofolate reductase
MAAARGRLIRYGVAMSLYGFIAGPDGEFDWIISDPSLDLAAYARQFDTLLMGRRTYELAISQGPMLKSMGMTVFVVSATLAPSEHKDATIISADIPQAVAKLKAQPGKDIWLFGGGALFRTLLDARLVDLVDVSVIPVLLGSGVPLIPAGRRWPLHLEESKTLPSGILQLAYSPGV